MHIQRSNALCIRALEVVLPGRRRDEQGGGVVVGVGRRPALHRWVMIFIGMHRRVTPLSRHDWELSRRWCCMMKQTTSGEISKLRAVRGTLCAVHFGKQGHLLTAPAHRAGPSATPTACNGSALGIAIMHQICAS